MHKNKKTNSKGKEKKETDRMTNSVSPEELCSIKYLLSNDNQTHATTKPQINRTNQLPSQTISDIPTNNSRPVSSNLQSIQDSDSQEIPHPVITKPKIGRKSIMTPTQFDHFAKLVNDYEKANNIKMSWKHAAKLIQDITKQTSKIPRTSAARYLNLAEMRMIQI